MTGHPNATDYRNRGERDAAYWREMCADVVYSSFGSEDWHSARDEAEAELARINAEALR